MHIMFGSITITSRRFTFNYVKRYSEAVSVVHSEPSPPLKRKPKYIRHRIRDYFGFPFLINFMLTTMF